MNTRQRHELRLLAEQGSFDLAQMASDFGVSVRAIRYDIEGLNNAFASMAGGEVISVRQKTAQMEEGASPRKVLELMFAGGSDPAPESLGPEERVLLVAFTLCWLDDYVTAQSLADDLGVSLATARRDLQRARAYCERRGIPILGKRGRGFRVVADEKARRGAIAQAIRDYGAIAGVHSGLEMADYLRWFSGEELCQIGDIVREAEAHSGLYLDDVAFEALVVHIALSVKRCEERADPLDPQTRADESAQDSLQSRMASFVIRHVEEAFGVTLPEDEHCYIEMHIGARSSAALSDERHDAVLEFMCLSLIAEVSQELGVDLTQDSHLYKRLLQHMTGSVYRRQMGLLLENPLRDELLSSYPAHAGVVAGALERNGFVSLIEMSDDEVAYVLLHFEAALVGGPPKRRRRANVVVVCSTGVGTAELLAAELSRSLDVRIVASVPAHQAPRHADVTDCDLVVSTVALDIAAPCVVVRPIPSAKDIERVAGVLEGLGLSAEHDQPMPRGMSGDAQEVLGILRRHLGRGEEGELRRELVEFLSAGKAHKRKGGYMLSELLEGGHVVLDAECDTWEEAVKASGRPLVDSGDITDDYVDAVIANIKEAGPYVVITKGVALPHATNRVGVNNTAMSCVRLKAPVCFGSEENDPVRFEFMLATVDATSHLKALTSLVGLLRTREFRDVLESATSGDQVISYIRRFEQENASQIGR